MHCTALKKLFFGEKNLNPKRERVNRFVLSICWLGTNYTVTHATKLLYFVSWQYIIMIRKAVYPQILVCSTLNGFQQKKVNASFNNIIMWFFCIAQWYFLNSTISRQYYCYSCLCTTTAVMRVASTTCVNKYVLEDSISRIAILWWHQRGHIQWVLTVGLPLPQCSFSSSSGGLGTRPPPK